MTIWKRPFTFWRPKRHLKQIKVSVRLPCIIRPTHLGDDREAVISSVRLVNSFQAETNTLAKNKKCIRRLMHTHTQAKVMETISFHLPMIHSFHYTNMLRCENWFESLGEPSSLFSNLHLSFLFPNAFGDYKWLPLHSNLHVLAVLRHRNQSSPKKEEAFDCEFLSLFAHSLTYGANQLDYLMLNMYENLTVRMLSNFKFKSFITRRFILSPLPLLSLHLLPFLLLLFTWIP